MSVYDQRLYVGEGKSFFEVFETRQGRKVHTGHNAASTSFSLFLIGNSKYLIYGAYPDPHSLYSSLNILNAETSLPALWQRTPFSGMTQAPEYISVTEDGFALAAFGSSYKVITTDLTSGAVRWNFTVHQYLTQPLFVDTAGGISYVRVIQT